MSETLWSGWYYRLPDGRRFLLLSCDYDRNIARLFWTEPERKHQDVSFADVAGAVRDGKPGR